MLEKPPFVVPHYRVVGCKKWLLRPSLLCYRIGPQGVEEDLF